MAACGVNGNGQVVVVWRCTQHTLSVQWVVVDSAGGGMPSLLLTEDLYGRTVGGSMPSLLLTEDLYGRTVDGGMPSLLLIEDLYGRTGQCVDVTRCGLLGEVASSYENLFFICCS